METYNISTSGDIPKAWVNTSGKRWILRVDECMVLGDDVVFQFNGVEYRINPDDTLNINDAPVTGSAEQKSTAIQTALKSFFPKASGTGSGGVQSDDVTSIVELSQAAYNALSPKDSETLYLITS